MISRCEARWSWFHEHLESPPYGCWSQGSIGRSQTPQQANAKAAAKSGAKGWLPEFGKSPTDSGTFNVLWWPPRGAHLLDPVRHGAWVEWFNLFDPLCLSGICGAQPNAARPQRGLFPWHSDTQLNKHSLDDTQHSHLRYWSPQKPSIYTWRQNASPRFSRSSSDVVWEAKAAKATAKTGAGCDSKQGSHDLIGILFSDVCLSCDTPLLALLNMIMDMDNYIWIHLILDTNTII